MAYTIKKQVRVDMRINGETVALDLEKGEHELDPQVAELLIAQGIAEVAQPQPAAKPKTAKTESAKTTKE